jgi:hypothetical protein
VQKIQVLGFNDGTIDQLQHRSGYPVLKKGRIAENRFLHSAAEFPYRNPAGPESLIDKTLNVDFRMNSGFLNYFILFESFFYQHTRDREYKDLPDNMYVEIMNQYGDVYARIRLSNPLISGMDMLDLDFTQPVASSQTFRVIFRFSDFDFEFIEDDAVTQQDIYTLPTRKDVPVYNAESYANKTYYEMTKEETDMLRKMNALKASSDGLAAGEDGMHTEVIDTDNMNIRTSPSEPVANGGPHSPSINGMKHVVLTDNL